MASNMTSDGRALVLVDAGQGSDRQARSFAGRYPDASFEAQLLGQPGQKRGLRGGVPVLEAARGAYLSAEFTGPGDRRPAPGLLTIREV